MRPARTEPNLTEWIVLALVGEGPTHGWAIVQAFRPRGAIGSIWATTGPLVYRAISRLEEAGLLRAAGTERGHGGPGRVNLVLEPAGQERVGAWLTRPVDHVRDLRTELLVKLVLLDRRGLDHEPLVRAQLDRLRPIVDALSRRTAEASGVELIVDRWRATNADAAVRFLETLLADRDDDTARRP